MSVDHGTLRSNIQGVSPTWEGTCAKPETLLVNVPAGLGVNALTLEVKHDSG